MTTDSVAAAYTAKAEDYIDAVGRIGHTAVVDREFIRDWALGCTGPLLDVGCGPGQWTDWLCRHGVQITGVDPASAFVERARSSYPGANYRVGQADDLGEDAGSVGGVLAWYSLIHSEVAEVESALAEFARCVRPDGGLLIGFFAGDEHEPFDHAVTTAYYWPVDEMAAVVEDAGFRVTHTATRSQDGARRHGEITAVRRGDY
ncbi:MAG TPA: class I SAM-dependent methyltransferase [Candidatus Corynebacterium avicola]|uniref:Class I SAM-dependent methyltransferase n=1 Tax=Candidatus Corynebacterium avicola TaxID=2838527 RepID=A0A9D1RP96_9CORY|nr:class I SAM-dependent methyltransferase [Candidatus Corynebacterium avicola]